MTCVHMEDTGKRYLPFLSTLPLSPRLVSFVQLVHTGGMCFALMFSCALTACSFVLCIVCPASRYIDLLGILAGSEFWCLWIMWLKPSTWRLLCEHKQREFVCVCWSVCCLFTACAVFLAASRTSCPTAGRTAFGVVSALILAVPVGVWWCLLFICVSLVYHTEYFYKLISHLRVLLHLFI